MYCSLFSDASLSAPILLAAVEDWIVPVTIAVLTGFSMLLNFVMTQLKESAAKADRERQAKQANREGAADGFDRPVGPAGRERQAPASTPAEVTNEIEEFLRRAAAKRDGATSGRREPAPSERKQNKQQRPKADREPRKRRTPGGRSPAGQPVVVAELVTEQRRSSFDDTSRNISGGSEPRFVGGLEERSLARQPLGTIGGTERLSDSLRDNVFSQPFGQDSLKTTQADPNAPVVAQVVGTPLTIAELLRGGNLKQAIILNEILTRPEERW